MTLSAILTLSAWWRKSNQIVDGKINDIGNDLKGPATKKGLQPSIEYP